MRALFARHFLNIVCFKRNTVDLWLVHQVYYTKLMIHDMLRHGRNEVKKAIIRIVCFCTALLFCACNTQPTQGQGGVTLDTQGSNVLSQTEIKSDEITGELCIYLEAMYADDLSNPLVWQTIKAFQEEYPNITLTFASPTGGVNNAQSREAEITRIETEIIAGGGPDVFLFGWDDYTDCKLFPDLEKAMQNGTFLDCSNALLSFGVDTTSDDFWQVIMETGRIGDAQYFVPLSFDVDIAVGAQNTVTASGFDYDMAQQSTAAFITEIEQAYLQDNNYTTNFLSNSISNLATPVMDYSASTIRLEDTKVRDMFALEKELSSADWNQGQDDLQAELTQVGLAQFYPQEAARLTDGERLFCVWGSDNAVQLLWNMSASGTEATILNLPNEYGSGTAVVDSCAVINANTQNELAAGLFVAYLLGEEAQGSAGYPSTLTLPVRVDSLADAIYSYWDYRYNIWWINPTQEEISLWEESIATSYAPVTFTPYTEEEIANYHLALGAPLTDAMIADLYTVCENIIAASLETIFSKTIQSNFGEEGDDIIYDAYEQYMEGEIFYSELQTTLTGRLQLYLDE